MVGGNSVVDGGSVKVTGKMEEDIDGAIEEDSDSTIVERGEDVDPRLEEEVIDVDTIGVFITTVDVCGIGVNGVVDSDVVKTSDGMEGSLLEESVGSDMKNDEKSENNDELSTAENVEPTNVIDKLIGGVAVTSSEDVDRCTEEDNESTIVEREEEDSDSRDENVGSIVDETKLEISGREVVSTNEVDSVNGGGGTGGGAGGSKKLGEGEGENSNVEKSLGVEGETNGVSKDGDSVNSEKDGELNRDED